MPLATGAVIHHNIFALVEFLRKAPAHCSDCHWQDCGRDCGWYSRASNITVSMTRTWSLVSSQTQANSSSDSNATATRISASGGNGLTYFVFRCVQVVQKVGSLAPCSPPFGPLCSIESFPETNVVKQAKNKTQGRQYLLVDCKSYKVESRTQKVESKVTGRKQTVKRRQQKVESRQQRVQRVDGRYQMLVSRQQIVQSRQQIVGSRQEQDSRIVGQQGSRQQIIDSRYQIVFSRSDLPFLQV